MIAAKALTDITNIPFPFSRGQCVFNRQEWIECCRRVECGEADGIQGKLGAHEIQDKTVSALWPFVVRRGRLKDIGIRIIEPLGAERTDYIIPTLLADGGSESARAIVRRLAEFLDFHAFVRFPKLLLPKSCVRKIGEYFRENGVELVSLRDRHVLRMRLRSTWNEQCASWSRNHRGDVRRRLRRLREKGDVELFVAQSTDAVKKRLVNLFSAHTQKWANEGKVSEFCSERNKEFFYLLTDNLPFEMIHYSEVRVNGRAISYHFGFLDNGWLLWYKPAYDPAFADLSPGKVHVALLIQEGLRKGWRGIDFLQGNEPYKFQWADHAVETYSIIAAKKPALVAYLWETRLREFVKENWSSLQAQRLALCKSWTNLLGRRSG